MAKIRRETRAAAPLGIVWDVLYDQVGMAAWLPVSVRLERDGDPPPNGVGAIRVVSRFGWRAREQITAVEPPTRLAYRLLSGLPVRNYVGETVLTAGNGETNIVWTVVLRSRIPGLASLVRLSVGTLVKRLAAESERRALTAGSVL